MNIEPQTLENDPKKSPSNDFKRGFLLWFLIAGVLVLPCWFLILLGDFMVRDTNPSQTNIYFSLPILINGIAVSWLFSKSRRLGWGMLAAIGLNILVNLIAFSLVPDASLQSFMDDFSLNALGLLGLLNIPIWLLIIFF